MVEIAEALTKENNIDVFIVEKPPRYDPPAQDPSSMKQKLSRFANGVLSTSTGPTPRLFLVEQASLARAAGRGRSDLFQTDGLHLTAKGLHFYNTNIINTMKECYGDTQLIKKVGKRVTSDSHSQSGSRVHDRDVRRGGDWDEHARGERQNQQVHYRSDRGSDRNEDRRGYRHGGQGAWRYPPPPQHGWGGNGGDMWGRGEYWGYNSTGGLGGGFRKGRRNDY